MRLMRTGVTLIAVVAMLTTGLAGSAVGAVEDPSVVVSEDIDTTVADGLLFDSVQYTGGGGDDDDGGTCSGDVCVS